ncbi:BREX-2 system adenine-specific DNA-methyltransferase PglX [Spongiactinospora sp. TRM90649]|uniref:BREX-2 system adenine-specific DNA-methyltransferase PglX n=1 Tax=Spongiactinospora sp. TRM90649 TaxID=3031114 RepID=UPI0023F74FE0|nr:BREX-2 system adenine-specific DNA-methyltransferase PglX [Spongiactinospora sp. TRM90649]MDF5759284.1 BREX-2 system adenine-specific DNA-methyltransferase PglX [Spongiactinospora sp. TRM90649]
MDRGAPIRMGIEHTHLLATGAAIRDFSVKFAHVSIWPYGEALERLDESSIPATLSFLWPYRRKLQMRKRFGKPVETIPGLQWYDYRELYREKLKGDFAITFAEVASHNHFVLVQKEVLCNQTAPMIKLKEGVGRNGYLRLLGLLNSSVAAFWLKMNCQKKGGSPESGGGEADQPWSWSYQFNGSNVERFPIPLKGFVLSDSAFDAISRRIAATNPSAIMDCAVPTVAVLREAKDEWHRSRAKMIAFQEELDWQAYSLYNLLSDGPLTFDKAGAPGLALGERAFEIVLARKMAKGEASEDWFDRHGSRPITEIPSHWPDAYKRIVQKRIDAIESSRAIGMIERPEYKRRWATEGWDALQDKALRSWLLDRIERREHWYDENGQPTITTLARLADTLSRDADFVSVANIYAPRRDLLAVVTDLMADEHVPFLAALRYKPSGLKKRVDWEHVWDLQRQEDAAPDEPAKRRIRDSIPVPPKYASADFLKASYWRARGKLDVPKERFISYSSTGSSTIDLYGWAGWDHREQAQVLATYFTNQPLTTEEIAPFLAGLLELQPWLYQWHNDFDATYSSSPAAFFAAYRQQIQGEHALTDDDLRNWRPPASTRARRTAKKK